MLHTTSTVYENMVRATSHPLSVTISTKRTRGVVPHENMRNMNRATGPDDEIGREWEFWMLYAAGKG